MCWSIVVHTSFDDIVEGIYAGRMHLARTGVHCYRNCGTPRKKVLNLFLAGGELDQIVDMNDDNGLGCRTDVQLERCLDELVGKKY